MVIEGMDNSGKSTLAQTLADHMGLFIQESEGPPLSAEEINERVDRYETMGLNYLFVRHPVISNGIYGQVREEGDPITPGRRMIFYDAKPLLIYCDAGTRGLGSHVEKAHDTAKHLEDITNNYNKLLFLYRTWAAERAHFVYRIGDDVDEFCATVAFAYHYRFSN
jgi:protein tyrosine phosphatase (PTP) superfamily phosphohydrolase (DUF442 family)